MQDLFIREALIRMGKSDRSGHHLGREHLIAVGPIGVGLGRHILRYADEVSKSIRPSRKCAESEIGSVILACRQRLEMDLTGAVADTMTCQARLEPSERVSARLERPRRAGS